jgi:DNA-binding NtrC family response regulator
MQVVMILEDDKDSAQMLEMIFELEGFEVCAFDDFGLAVQSLDIRCPCIALVDYHCRNNAMTTGQFVSALRRRVHDVKIIVLSGDNRVRGDCDRMGIDGFILKPAESAFLVELVRNYCSAERA